jgi:hypothetical protein
VSARLAFDPFNLHACASNALQAAMAHRLRSRGQGKAIFSGIRVALGLQRSGREHPTRLKPARDRVVAYS